MVDHYLICIEFKSQEDDNARLQAISAGAMSFASMPIMPRFQLISNAPGY